DAVVLAGVDVEADGESVIVGCVVVEHTVVVDDRIGLAVLQRFERERKVLIGDDLGVLEVLVRIVESGDRKSTRLNSSHVSISYAVFCLKIKNTLPNTRYL